MIVTIPAQNANLALAGGGDAPFSMSVDMYSIVSGLRIAQRAEEFGTSAVVQRADIALCRAK